MEEEIRKRGILYLQQQRFGKKWKKVWATLYRESSCSISRLEYFEAKDGTLEKPKGKQENKKIIKLSDCIRVAEAESDGCPKDCRAFLVETTEKTFVFSVEVSEQEDWMQKLCEIAFPMNWGERGSSKRGSFQSETDEVTMKDNLLYGGKEAAMMNFKVTMRRTEAADRCGLRGHYLLRTDFDSLLLKEPKTGEVLFTWPYRYLRRFGRDKTTFSFEAGRRCDSGEGNFEFETKQGNGIFQHIEAAINLQKASLSQQPSGSPLEREPVLQPPKVTPPPDDGDFTIYSMLTDKTMKEQPKQTSPRRSRLETPTEKHLTSVKSLNLEAQLLPRKNKVKNFLSCPLAGAEDEAYSRVAAKLSEREIPDRVEHEEQNRAVDPFTCCPESPYSLPFDSIAKNVMVEILASTHLVPSNLVEPADENGADPRLPEPLYDSIDECAVRSAIAPKPRQHSKNYPMDHIYDKPEDCVAAPGATTALYDNPEEVRGHAWKTHGFKHDPSGHEYPYDAQADDYAVPNPARRAVKPEQEKKKKKKKMKEKAKEEDMEDSPYDNVMIKK